MALKGIFLSSDWSLLYDTQSKSTLTGSEITARGLPMRQKLTFGNQSFDTKVLLLLVSRQLTSSLAKVPLENQRSRGKTPFVLLCCAFKHSIKIFHEQNMFQTIRKRISKFSFEAQIVQIRISGDQIVPSSTPFNQPFKPRG